MMKRDSVKPFVWGIVLGGVVATIAGFSAGWVVTTGARDQQVQAAWVDGQAKVCVTLVQAHRLASGDVTPLNGYQARDARDKLAQAFAVVLPGSAVADPGVVKACSGILDKPNAT